MVGRPPRSALENSENARTGLVKSDVCGESATSVVRRLGRKRDGIFAVKFGSMQKVECRTGGGAITSGSGTLQVVAAALVICTGNSRESQ